MKLQSGSSAESNLDILRAVAVLMVLAAHVIEMAAVQNPDLSIHPFNLILGRLGVLFFFVHTALVLNASMERTGMRGWGDIRNFYVRRAFRIYPLAIATVLLVVAFEVPAMPWREYQATFASIVASITLTSNLLYIDPVQVPMWSLPIEMQMYLLLPIIYLIVRKRPMWAFALWVLSVPVAWLQPTYLGRLNVLAYAPCFLGGVLAFCLAGKSKLSLPAWTLLPTLLLISVAYLVVQGSMQNIHYPPVTWVPCLVLGALIPSFVNSTAKTLNAVAAFIAKYSYGIYLTHVIALWVGCVVLGEAPYWLQWAVAALTMCVLTGLGYHFIEAPAIRLGSSLVNGRRAVSQTA